MPKRAPCETCTYQLVPPQDPPRRPGFAGQAVIVALHGETKVAQVDFKVKVDNVVETIHFEVIDLENHLGNGTTDRMMGKLFDAYPDHEVVESDGIDTNREFTDRLRRTHPAYHRPGCFVGGGCVCELGGRVRSVEPD